MKIHLSNYKTGVLVVDIQEGIIRGLFKQGRINTKNIEEITSKANEVVKTACDNEIYVLEVKTEHKGLSPKSLTCLESSSGFRFVRSEGSAFSKQGTYENIATEYQRINCMHQRKKYHPLITFLAEILDHRRIKNLVIAGLNIDSSLDSTVIEADKLGFSVITSKDLYLTANPTLDSPLRPRNILERRTRLVRNYKEVQKYLESLKQQAA